MTTATCEHTEALHDVAAQTPDGCAECLASGSQWVHLRKCLSCGHIGCCDSSPNKHATSHYNQTQHPIMASFEAGEDWAWCYLDAIMLQPAPKPA